MQKGNEKINSGSTYCVCAAVRCKSAMLQKHKLKGASVLCQLFPAVLCLETELLYSALQTLAESALKSLCHL